MKWLHVVPSVYHAKKAEKAGVDEVIASGHEGGGHIAWKPVHTMILLPEIVRAVKVPVVGAGGFCDGATLVAALSLGAVGIQMGTRFIATKESDFIQMWKDHITKVGERDSIVVRGLAGPARALETMFGLEVANATVRKLPRMYLGEDVGIDDEVGAMEAEGLSRIFETPNDPENLLLLGGSRWTNKIYSNRKRAHRNDNERSRKDNPKNAEIPEYACLKVSLRKKFFIKTRLMVVEARASPLTYFC